MLLLLLKIRWRNSSSWRHKHWWRHKLRWRNKLRRMISICILRWWIEHRRKCRRIHWWQRSLRLWRTSGVHLPRCVISIILCHHCLLLQLLILQLPLLVIILIIRSKVFSVLPSANMLLTARC